LIDNFQITCNGDGTTNANDDYPNDPNRSARSYYPNSGYESIYFEDLWPVTGDYDFNDLVLSQKVEIARNSSGELVDAQFKVSIDAIGAGFSNGIRMLFRNNLKEVVSGS
jgi:hypothetical protein